VAQTESGADAAAARRRAGREGWVAAGRGPKELEKRAVEGKGRRSGPSRGKRERVLKKKWRCAREPARRLSLAGTIHPRLNEHQALMLREILADVRPDTEAPRRQTQETGVRSIALTCRMAEDSQRKKRRRVLKITHGCVTKYCMPCAIRRKRSPSVLPTRCDGSCACVPGGLQAPWTSSYPSTSRGDGTLTNVLQHRAQQRRSGDGGRAGEHGAQQVSYSSAWITLSLTLPPAKVGWQVWVVHSDRSPEIAGADFIKEVLGPTKLETWNAGVACSRLQKATSKHMIAEIAGLY
jgi:hypothetical protein